MDRITRAIQWIVNNKEWLFSGVGIVVLALVARWVIPPRRQKVGITPATQPEQPSPPPLGSLPASRPADEVQASQYRSHPLPEEIFRELDGCPPYGRTAAAASYVGLRVKWYVKLLDVSSLREGEFYVMAHTPGLFRPPQICFDVQMEQYPELKTAKREQGMWVRGEIERVSILDVHLKGVSVDLE